MNSQNIEFFERSRNLICQNPGMTGKARELVSGELGEFRGGVMKLLETDPVPVVPLALQNLWGSYFSRVDGAAMSKPFRRGLFSSVGLVAGAAVPPVGVTPTLLRDRVAQLLAT